MTDNQIATELARTIHGWKLAPMSMSERSKFFANKDNYPCLDANSGDLRLVTNSGSRQWTPGSRQWNPFDAEHGWNDAMALAEAWRQIGVRSYSLGCGADGVWCVTCTDIGEESIEQYLTTDPSGPRAVCMALAQVMGIEVEK